MERNEKETHNFMNVESFSQLPFIRPAPPINDKPSIRLFGIEFAGDNPLVAAAGSNETTTESAETTTEDSSTTVKEIQENNSNSNSNSNSNENNKNNSNNRRFECHYCCRNFPTSQALGGHQNAHKRERQHAKRAHLQSAMVHSSLSDAHLYGHLMNYRPSSIVVPSWNTTNNGGSKYYSSYNTSYNSQPHQHSQPINGSPLGLWRIPSVVQSNNSTFHRDRSLIMSNTSNNNHQVPLFSGDHEVLKPNSHLVQHHHRHQTNIGGLASQSRYVYESKSSVKDPVSLDLHL